jgi:hypothetical protein
MPCIVLLVTGCAGAPALTQSTGTPALTQRAAPPAQDAEDVTHPLSYKSIQLAAYSEAEPLVDVGFDRRYDVYCMLFPETSTVYRNCKIVGVTGRDRRKSEDFSSASKKQISQEGIGIPATSWRTCLFWKPRTAA